MEVYEAILHYGYDGDQEELGLFRTLEAAKAKVEKSAIAHGIELGPWTQEPNGAIVAIEMDEDGFELTDDEWSWSWAIYPKTLQE